MAPRIAHNSRFLWVQSPLCTQDRHAKVSRACCVLGGCHATGAVAIAASPLPSGRASQRSPSPPQMSCQNRFDDEDNASMFELPVNRQHRLGTERNVSSRPSRIVTIVRHLELCGQAHGSKGWRDPVGATAAPGEIEPTCEPGPILMWPIQASEETGAFHDLVGGGPLR